ncbi:MAG: F420-dependent methylenetetrahydromethanopterin dehydrogenase [Methanonatronarchaeales archaeon]|nr:F420-dependent methylenetetrahydromethanopterin dehydrogenase [Methanonatronarchaeales archaeon]
MRLGVAKAGNIGVSSMLELLLDERADRENLEVFVEGSGAKMDVEEVEGCVERVLAGDPDVVVYVSPNLTVRGPQRAAEVLAESGVPAVLVGDSPSREAAEGLEEMGLGFVVVTGDPMIGARREFLDPAEMALFNGHVLEVLSCTGAMTAVQAALDGFLESGGDELPRLVVDRDSAVKHAEFRNPYAEAKAMAAYEISEKAADLDVEGCFVVQDPEKYVPLVAAAHEMVREAARLADEARELEKAGDSVSRAPHARDGTVLSKERLMEKPK